MKARGDFGEDARVRGVFAGNLRAAETRGLGNGSGDEGELLSTDAGRGKIHGVVRAEGGDSFEGGGEAGDFLVHKIFAG